MNIFMPEKQQQYFEKTLNNCNSYLEFGAGSSTIYASNNIKNKGLTFESDYNWFKRVNEQIVNDKYNIVYIDIETVDNTWGYPGKNCSLEKQEKYSTEFKKYIKELKPDVIFIDGRYRVSCALQIHEYISPETRVLFDDFLNRPHYHEILDYYDIIHKVDNMVELRKKNIIVPNSVKNKYITIPK
jgi:ABC-type sulfate transport system substrate-binding protein